MTDRELMQMALEAAGYWIVGPVEKYIVQPGHYECGFVIRNDRGGDSCWNPLTDDGDALRLAVKLKIDVCWNQNEGPWEVNAWPRQRCGCGEEEAGDPYAATRRAIVRAAAEIGRSME